MGRTGRLLVFASAVLCLLGAFLLLRVPRETPRAEENSSGAGTYEMLYERSLPAFCSVTVHLPGESYTLVSDLVYSEDGTMQGVRNSMGQPMVVDGENGFKLDYTAWQVMLVAAQHLPVTNSWEGIDTAACGLVTPAASLTLCYEGEEDVTLTVGSLISSTLGCYVTVSGSDRVYAAPADFYEVVTRPLKGLHALPGACAEAVSDSVQAAVVDGETWIFTRRGREGSLAEWQVTSPFTHDASADAVERLVEGVCAIHADGYAGALTEAGDMETYGFDSPKRLLAAFSDGTIRDITLGGAAEDGNVYALLDRSGDVYTVAPEQLRFLDGCPPNALLDPFVYLVSYKLVSCIDITWAGGECALSRQDADGGSVFFMDGRQIESSAWSSLYSAVIGVTMDDVTAEPSAFGEEVMRLSYTMTDGTEKQVVFSRYDDFYDLARADGGCFLVRSRQRLELLSRLAEQKADGA